MNVAVTIDNVGRNIVVLERYIDEVEILLGLDAYDYGSEMVDAESAYYEDPGYLSYMPESLADNIVEFASMVYYASIDKQDLMRRYKEFITQSSERDVYDFIMYLMNYRNLLMEGGIYAASEGAECQTRTVSVYVNEALCGRTFLFWKDEAPYFMMQGICKMLPIAFIDKFYPQYASTYGKLNSMINPVLQSFARLNGFSKIVVKPVGNQGNILVKHYGYKQGYSKLKYPCDIILGYAEGPFQDPVCTLTID